ncbi:hypothetical protein Hypma_013181 [Hypsizygus marmoreus]|uniref:Yeast cell wall synthesis Kre9/Knh1-like N-terminal domain-containing protein n=1 Tax=Hypsizygus marmoreus TaxID=39966 RepID=A0A369JK05_HYPMA|nr:hypothetical protein Hypma_013181 [Hypsizygus marmoreus]
MFAKSLILLALSASAFATVFTTNPVASTTFTGGKPATISWQEDGKTPALKDFGAASVSIYVGNAQQQTRLQTVVESVDVSTTGSIQFTPDASIGPNGNEYFIRFESLALKDAAQPQFPALAFSAKFTMNSMTGVFNQEVQAQINGQSTAPLAGATAAPSTTNPAPSASTTTSKPTTGTSTKSSATATNVNTANGAVGVQAGWFGVLIGAIIGASMF